MNRIDINPTTKTVTLRYDFTESLEPYYWYMKHVDKIVFENNRANDYREYRYPISLKSLPNIKVLILKDRQNCPLTLNSCITTLVLGKDFTRKLILTNNITTIAFGGYTSDVQFTKNIEYATFGENFNGNVELNKNIKHIAFGEQYNQNVFLTKNLVHVHFGFWYGQIIILPKAITHVLIESGAQIKTLTKNIVHLEIGHCLGKLFKLSKRIKHLEIGYSSSENSIPTLELPKYLIHLEIANIPINCLTPYVKHLNISNCKSRIVLEHGKTQMSVQDRSNSSTSYILENLPNNVICVLISKHTMETYMRNLPNSVKGFVG